MKSSEAYRDSIEQKADGIMRKRKQRTRTIKGISSAAACLTLVICTMMIAPGLWGTDPIIDKPGVTGSASTGNEQANQPPVIHMNAVTEGMGSVRMFFDPEKTYEESWDWNQIVAYFGKDIAPDYVPDGLKPNPLLTQQTVILNNDGTLAYDAIWLQYFSFYYEDGSQAIGGDSTGIQIIASKTGYQSCGLHVWPDGLKESSINSISVKFGHRSIGWGGTFESPDSYYDFFVAEFSKDGINFEVTASNIAEEEFIKVVDSLTR